MKSTRLVQKIAEYINLQEVVYDKEDKPFKSHVYHPWRLKSLFFFFDSGCLLIDEVVYMKNMDEWMIPSSAAMALIDETKELISFMSIWDA